MKKLLLHIGMPKTGSTSIQHFLKDNEVKLANHRIHYIKAGFGPKRTKQSKLAQPLAYTLTPAAERREPPKVKREETANLLQQAIEEMETTDFDTYVISVEELFPTFVDDITTSDTKVSELYRDWFNRVSEIAEITIIVYLRRQDLFVESLYAQFEKGGGSPLRLLTFTEFFNNLKTVGVFDYEKIVANLAAIPGVFEVIIRPFERTQLFGGDAVIDFARYMGLNDIDGFSISGEANTKNFPRQFSIMLQQAAVTQTDKELRRSFERMLESGKQLPEWALVNTGKYFMSPSARAQLVAEFQTGTDNLAKKYLDRDRMFTTEPSDSEDPNWTPPSDQEIQSTANHASTPPVVAQKPKGVQSNFAEDSAISTAQIRLTGRGKILRRIFGD